MFCPGCGLEQTNANQFCRACGADLRAVKFALEKTDQITAAAASARDEIGRAVAERIREIEYAEDLKQVAEDVLPQIEKFLESPAERRLRRVRTGTLISLIGLGAAIAFSLAAAFVDAKIFFFAGLGWVTFCIGLSFIINGLVFTVPKKSIADKSSDAGSQRELDATTGELGLPASTETFVSVTEHTTRHLKEEQSVPPSD